MGVNVSITSRSCTPTLQDMALARDRLLNGLAKLQETNVVVDKMQRELEELAPVLAAKTVDTTRLLAEVWARIVT